MDAATLPDETPSDADDLSCPLCEYSLRGLTEPRCPECGFAFTWAELRAADRSRHPWLFEHGRRRNVATFAKTWWRDGLPWRFWREVTPANPVNVGRLIAYWAVGGLLASVVLLAPLPHGLWPEWQSHVREVSRYQTYISRYGSTYSVRRPPTTAWDWLLDLWGRTWTVVRSADLLQPSVIGPPLLVLAWPWMSAAALMVFRLSMRQAMISPAHVLRATVYGCDFGLAMALPVFVFVPIDVIWVRHIDGSPLAYFALFCGLIATVRLTFAYARYLRFHLPLATVLASQVVVVLSVLTALARTTDLSRLFR